MTPRSSSDSEHLDTRELAQDTWFYPNEIKDDLLTVDLPEKFIAETLACGWEYARCVIPHFTNWQRYVAFIRIIVIGIVAEFRGNLVDVTAGDTLLGYDLNDLLDILFAGTPGREEMGRGYRAFLFTTSIKTSHKRQSDMFRRYVNALAESPKTWFRVRDCDALARFTMASALACNDVNDVRFSEDEFQIVAELGITLYDAVAFYKHRTEGETNSTFAYAGQELSLRTECYRRYREVLWGLDVAWAGSPGHRCVLNFLRFFGGPIHMTMRRYRFVEDGLTIGKPETDYVVNQTRENYKLWNRVDVLAAAENDLQADVKSYEDAMSRSNELLFPGQAEILERGGDGHCSQCQYRASYGAKTTGQFGGVRLCGGCRAEWQRYLETFQDRATKVFPILSHTLK
ncbi:hypothetical protein GQ53DRAFT_784052 [Thozetella sp. PMI_491]|nr:hypothetical protein GQ53DRAFT_784052 [Thozetella sp. PMI_491]